MYKNSLGAKALNPEPVYIIIFSTAASSSSSLKCNFQLRCSLFKRVQDTARATVNHSITGTIHSFTPTLNNTTSRVKESNLKKPKTSP